MTLAISVEEFQLLRELIEKECGIALGDEKAYLVESRLGKLVLENGCQNFGQFYLKVKGDPGTALKTKIIDAMTTNETLWFRDEHPYIALRDKIFPELAAQLQAGKKDQIRIWSAASSTGQEPYSVAMMARECAHIPGGFKLVNGGLSILATDISTPVLMLAKAGRYDSIAMSRGVLPGFKEKYFTDAGSGRIWAVKDEVKKMVTFQQFNLQNSFLSLGKFDLIMIRNVAIYFSQPFKVDLFKKIAQALNPGGYLILGASESLTGYSQDFKMIECGKTIIYQVK